MLKILKTLSVLLLTMVMFITGILIADKYTLRTGMIRLRVVASSDSAEDQKTKLEIRDEIINYLSVNMPKEITVTEAQAFLLDRLPELTQIAKEKLCSMGVNDTVSIYLCRESAKVRHYDTFSLPSGVYETLRVDIGNAQGENWWCVVFPSLCTPKTADAFEEKAVACGIPEGLSDTLSDNGGYEVRFFLLDCIGKLENLLNKG